MSAGDGPGGWPRRLWLVRHGESVGNVANAEAYASGAERLDLPMADPEVPLTDHGVRQAQALGERLARDLAESPAACLFSPYLRTVQTAERLLDAAGWGDIERTADERLRDREQGVFDRLTLTGIRKLHPDEAARRAALGKFYYRPPGGESWADIALRIRSLLRDLRIDHARAGVLLVTHDVPILVTRYVLEGLSVAEALALSGQVANCGLSEYSADRGGRLRLVRFNDTTPVAQDVQAAVTEHGERP